MEAKVTTLQAAATRAREEASKREAAAAALTLAKDEDLDQDAFLARFVAFRQACCMWDVRARRSIH
eukprot:63576-Prymnesium_polylepis.1